MPSRTTERINFGKIKEIIAPPNLIELQTNSYKEFLQAEVAPSKRKNLGLQAVFTEVFPIESYDGKSTLDFHSYEIGDPKQDWLECLREGPDLRRAALRDLPPQGRKGHEGGRRCSWSELPLMTPQGHFCLPGIQRRRARHCQGQLALAARSAPSRATQHPNGQDVSTPSASSPTAVPGTRPSSTRAICSTSTATAKNAAGNF